MEPSELDQELPISGQAIVSTPLRLTQTGEQRKRKEYKVTLIAAGFVRRRDGQPSDFYISAEALHQAAPMFQNAAVFVDHAPEGVWSPGYPETKHLAGVIHSPAWDEASQSIDATLRLNRRSDMAWLAELLDEVIDDQEKGEPCPDLGLSAVIFVDSAWREIPPTPPGAGGNQRVRWLNRIKAVESVDVVFGPGARGRFKEKLQRIEARNETGEILPLGDPPQSPLKGGKPEKGKTNIVIVREQTPTTGRCSRLLTNNQKGG